VDWVGLRGRSYPGMTAMLENGPSTSKILTHRTADIEVPDETAQGLIFAAGLRFAGL